MNLKTLRKKILKLETRLQEGPRKLVKLKRKLEAMTITKARKASVRATAARRTTKPAAPVQKKKSRAVAKLPTKAAVSPKSKPAKKAKRKLNLSPERRAQLSAMMKARWAAKRAAAEGNPGKSSANGDSASGENPQSP